MIRLLKWSDATITATSIPKVKGIKPILDMKSSVRKLPVSYGSLRAAATPTSTATAAQIKSDVPNSFRIFFIHIVIQCQPIKR